MYSTEANVYFRNHNDLIVETLRAHYITTGKLLGTGGFARVYSCFSKKYSQDFALKIFPLKINEKITESFYHEIDCLAELDHPFIIKIYQQFSDDFFAYIVMELCSGGTLNDKMEEQGFTAVEIKKIIMEIAKAIQFCHKKGIAHNDIKPRNILMNSDRHIKLTDFGISIKCNHGQKVLNKTGSICFMSPECFCHKFVDPFARDMWAFGMTVYQISEGQLPWISHNKAEIINEIIHYKHRNTQSISHLISKVCEVLLKYNPEERATPGDIISMLERDKYFSTKINKIPSPLINSIARFNTGRNSTVKLRPKIIMPIRLLGSKI